MKIKKIKKQRGFTLVEIIVVVAIIGILAAIAIPNFTRARVNANERAATAHLRAISTACESYRMAQAPSQYPSDLSTLGTGTFPYLDPTLAAATSTGTAKQGYYYTYSFSAASPNEYSCLAKPVSASDGTTNYFVNQTGVIYKGSGTTGSPIEG